jgi:hypothetical protein
MTGWGNVLFDCYWGMEAEPLDQKEALLRRQAEAREQKRQEESQLPAVVKEPEVAPPLAAPLRENLVSNAMTFLSSPSVQSAPLVRKVAYLETKGLTNEEITEALRRVGSPSTLPAPLSSTIAAAAPPVPPRVEYIVAPAPPPQSSTFRTVATSIAMTLAAIGGTGWLVSSFILPAMKERNKTARLVSDRSTECCGCFAHPFCTSGSGLTSSAYCIGFPGEIGV